MFPVGIGLRNPRSQKRDLGHPSVSPFDIAEGTSFVISLPTRLSESAARDNKGKGSSSVESRDWTETLLPGYHQHKKRGLRGFPREASFSAGLLSLVRLPVLDSFIVQVVLGRTVVGTAYHRLHADILHLRDQT